MAVATFDTRELARKLGAAGLSADESPALARLVRADQERAEVVQRQLGAVRAFAEADGRPAEDVLRDAAFVDAWRRNKVLTGMTLFLLALIFVCLGAALRAELGP